MSHAPGPVMLPTIKDAKVFCPLPRIQTFQFLLSLLHLPCDFTEDLLAFEGPWGPIRLFSLPRLFYDLKKGFLGVTKLSPICRIGWLHAQPVSRPTVNTCTGYTPLGQTRICWCCSTDPSCQFRPRIGRKRVVDCSALLGRLVHRFWAYLREKEVDGLPRSMRLQYILFWANCRP